MNSDLRQAQLSNLGRRSLFRLTLLVSLWLLMAGCGQPTTKKGSPQTEQSGNAIQAAVVETPTLTGPEKDATKMAPFYEERRLVAANSTKFALGTPYPTLGPYIEPTRGPEPTLVTGGPLGDCADANREFLYVGCWAERVGNEYLIIQSGASKPDLSQGMLRVYTMTWDLRGYYSDVSRKQLYTTPSRSGRVRIVGVNWPIMTLIALDSDPPVTFGFDLATRQWVSPPPQPTVYAQLTRRAEWMERVQTEVALTGTIPIPTRRPWVSPTSPPLPTPSLSVPPLPTLSPDLSPIPSVPPPP